MAWSYDETTEVYTVDTSGIDSLFPTLEQNTVDTPYKINVNESSSGSIMLAIMKLKNYTLYLDLSYTTFSYVMGLSQCKFQNFEYLVRAPHITDGENLNNFYDGCTNLKSVYIPNTMNQLVFMCRNCTSLEYVEFGFTDLTTYPAMSELFNNCTSLKLISVPNASVKSRLVSYLTSQQGYGYFPADIDPNDIVLTASYDVDTDTYTVPFSELETLLNNFPQNTVDTPYKLNITGLTSSQVTTSSSTMPALKTALGTVNNGDSARVYFDLSPTTLPSGITALRYSFYNAHGLVTAPIIPSTVTSLEETFDQCYSLKTAPAIPNSVTNMNSTFSLCYLLAEAPVLPPNVTNLTRAFRLTAITEPPVIPNKVTTMEYCFAETQITVMPELPSTLTNLSYCFYRCPIEETTTIPSNVTNMSHCFDECSNLKIVKNIPRNTTNVQSCFRLCENLKRIKLWDYNSISTANGANCFVGCDSLEAIWVNGYASSSRTNLINFLNTMKNNSGFPSDITPADIVFYGYTEGYSIAFGNLNNYLMYLEPNTVDNPYKLTVTGLSVANVNTSSTSGSLGYVIAHNTKYLDLSLTSLHANQTTMESRFFGCSYLVVPPSIPANVTNMVQCFDSCSNLTVAPSIPSKVTDLQACFYGTKITEAPTIPNSVTTMWGTFGECSLLESVPDIPDSVTNMKYCFYKCYSLEISPKLPSNLSNMEHCFEECTSLVKAPIIPNSVVNMANTFAGTPITVAPIIPSRVEDMEGCFKDCTSLVDVPSLPSLLPGLGLLSSLATAFDGCSALKRVNFNETFDLSGTNFYSAFNDCDDLESIFVKSSANRTALITELESQQNDGKFPSGLNVSEIVKFDEKTMRVQTEEGTEIVDLYRFKGQLLTEKNGELVYADEDFKPFSVQIDNETFFAQTIPESLLAICRNKGSGTVLKKMVGTEIVEGVTTPVYQWFTKSAGTIEEPFRKKNTTILSDISTETLDITIPKNLFPKGGRMLVCGAAGANVIDTATQNHVNYGGKGEVRAVEIPANPKEDLHILGVTFPKTSTNGETKDTSLRVCSGGTDSYGNCKGWSTTTVHGVSGGVGGNNCVVTYEKKGVSYTVTAYGGGGGGGGKAYGDSTTDYGNGGLSGDGNANVGSNGGNPYDIENCNVNELTTAFLRVEAYI